MNKIIIRQRLQVSMKDEKVHNLDFFNNAISFLRSGMIYRIWASDKSKSYQDIHQQYPQVVKDYNGQLTELLKFYFKLKPRLAYVLDRHQLEFERYEAEIFNIDFNNLNSLTVSIHFMTKEYWLIRNFGNYLLLTDNFQEENKPVETFTIKMSEDLSVHSYYN